MWTEDKHMEYIYSYVIRGENWNNDVSLQRWASTSAKTPICNWRDTEM